MGLDAWVRCRCWEEGKCNSVPDGVEPIRVDEEGYLSLDLPYEGNEPLHESFAQWLAQCCEHEEVEFACERISNWTGYRLFQQRLEEIGRQYFPTLFEELPEANGGVTSAESSKRILAELERFRELAAGGERVVLLDTDTKGVVFEYVAAYKGVFMMSGKGGIQAGVDDGGFFVASRETGVILFRSSDFVQEMEGDNGILTDRASGINFTTCQPISVYELSPDNDGTNSPRHPKHLVVEHRVTESGDFEYILGPLTTVFEASVATGNPVIWC